MGAYARGGGDMGYVILLGVVVVIGLVAYTFLFEDIDD